MAACALFGYTSYCKGAFFSQDPVPKNTDFLNFTALFSFHSAYPAMHSTVYMLRCAAQAALYTHCPPERKRAIEDALTSARSEATACWRCTSCSLRASRHVAYLFLLWSFTATIAATGEVSERRGKTTKQLNRRCTRTCRTCRT